MKTTLISVILLFLMVTACHKDTSIGPTDLLYRRWQWVETRTVDQQIVRPDSTHPTVITFKPSGEYVYEFNGKRFTCCQPNRFVQRGNQLAFFSVPGGYTSPECAYVSCAPYQPEQIIEALSDQHLSLSTNRGQTLYKAVP